MDARQNTPPVITSAGKPCKLCKKKGDRCHLHGGTPREYSKHWKALYEKEKKEYIDAWKSQNEPGIWFTPLQKDIPYITFKEWLKGKEGAISPKKKATPKSAGRKSPKNKDVKSVSDLDDLFGTFDAVMERKSPPKTPPAEFHYFHSLPKPALQNIMLDLPWDELMAVCLYVGEARAICKLPNFRRMYAKRQIIPPPSLFLKPITPGQLPRGFRPEYTFAYKDRRGTEILLQYSDDYHGFRVMLQINFSSGVGVNISRDRGEELTAALLRTPSPEKFFSQIGRPEWSDEYKTRGSEGWEKRQKIIKLIVQDVKDALGPKMQPGVRLPLAMGGTYKQNLIDHLLE